MTFAEWIDGLVRKRVSVSGGHVVFDTKGDPQNLVGHLSERLSRKPALMDREDPYVDGSEYQVSIIFLTRKFDLELDQALLVIRAASGELYASARKTPLGRVKYLLTKRPEIRSAEFVYGRYETLLDVLSWAMTAVVEHDFSQPELEYARSVMATYEVHARDQQAFQFWSRQSGPWPQSRLQAIVDLEAEFASEDRDVRAQSAAPSGPLTAEPALPEWLPGGLLVLWLGGMISLIAIEQFAAAGMLVGVSVVAGFLWNREKERRASEMKSELEAQRSSRAYELSDLHQKQGERRGRLARRED